MITLLKQMFHCEVAVTGDRNMKKVICDRCGGILTADDTFRLLSACKSCRDKYMAHIRSVRAKSTKP